MRVASHIAVAGPAWLNAGAMAYCGPHGFVRDNRFAVTRVDALTGSKHEKIPD